MSTDWPLGHVTDFGSGYHASLVNTGNVEEFAVLFWLSYLDFVINTTYIMLDGDFKG